MMTTKTNLIISSIIFAVIIMSLSGCYNNRVKYVKKNIDDIIYTEPTQEARDFDIKAYMDDLPEVEYEKIDYPVKEVYTYEFNNYKLTVDIPEGFEARILPLEEKIKVIDSEGFEDSCCTVNQIRYCAAEDELNALANFYKGCIPKLISDNELCLFKSANKIKYTDNSSTFCNDVQGIIFKPLKSKYSGLSMKNIYYDWEIWNTTNQKRAGYKKYHSDNNLYYLMESERYNSKTFLTVLVSDNQQLTTNVLDKNNYNLYFSILNSVKIEEM